MLKTSISLPIFIIAFSSFVQNSFSENKTQSLDSNDTINNLGFGVAKFCVANGTMVIKGYDLKLSDFVRTNGDIYNLCGKGFTVKSVKVFSLNTVVIDTDINVVGSHFKLFVIAPRWLIIGNRKISVDGFKGSYIPRAKDGDVNNTGGEDGKPGLPGGPGGSFFGIGDTFINGHSLVITANGGIGGTGQYGGNGYDQKRARYVHINTLGKIWCGLFYDICRSRDKQHQLHLQDNFGNYSDFYCQGLYEEGTMKSCSYKILGWEGEEGGRGGNGGRGGKGGLPGTVKLVDLHDNSQVSTYNTLGKYGKDGKGGVGGKRGLNGFNVIYTDVFFLAPPKIKFEHRQKYLSRLGANGSDGYSSVTNYTTQPEKAEVLEHKEVLSVVNEYKEWLRDSFELVTNHKYLLTFYKYLEENKYIRSLYNTSDVLKDIQDINEQLMKAKVAADFSPFYESLLDRIRFHVETFKNDSSRDQDRQILILSYTDILGKKYSFFKRPTNYLVIEIPKYLEAVKNNLEEVLEIINNNGTMDEIVDQVNALNEYKENYEKQVNKLIKKSREYSENKITVQINKTEDSVIQNISKIISDLTEAKKIPISYEQEILMWGKHLEDTLVLRSFYNSVKLLNSCYGVLSDLAEVISLAVEAGSRVPESLLLQKQDTTADNLSPQVLQKLNQQVDNLKTTEVTRITNLSKGILKSLQRTPELLTDVAEEVDFIYRKLHENNNRFYQVNAIRSDLLQALRIKKEELSSFNVSLGETKNNNKSTLSSHGRLAFYELSNIISMLKMGRGFDEVYCEYKNDTNKIDIIIESVSTTYNVLQDVKHFENNIYNVTYTMLQRVEDTLLEATRNPSKIPKLALDISKLKIQLSLKTIKQYIRQSTDKFHENYHIFQALEHLGGVCNVLISVFDRLEDYLEQTQLENFIADSNAAIQDGMAFTDESLSTTFETIKKSLGANIVLQHYQKAVDTFKQFVFPIAHVYLQDIILPDQFHIFDDIGNVTYAAITQIDKMMDKVKDYKSALLNGSDLIHRTNFGSGDQGLKPFFVWKNGQHKKTISKILSGNEAVLNADITSSNISEYAIKINTVEVYFSCRNKTLQEKFDYAMGLFEISATQMGNSQYRFDNDLYLITSDPLGIWYYFEKNEDGIPILTGGSYDFITNANIMISPFALWKIQLQPIDEDAMFDDLAEFKDQVDLELRGNGYYINKDKLDSLDLHVNKYYKPLDPFDQFELHDGS